MKTLLTIILSDKELTAETSCAKWRETVAVSLEFKIQDLWIGVFWKTGKGEFDLWLCLLPCLPIHFYTRK